MSWSHIVKLVRAGLAAVMLTGPVLAQPAAENDAAAPALTLSAEQKQTIYQSVSNTQKNNPAPPGFRPAVGAHVPDAIELSPMPATIAKLIPAAKDLEVAMVEKQVVLVAPKTKSVVLVVTPQE